jgi:prevent-host-death family protein
VTGPGRPDRTRLDHMDLVNVYEAKTHLSRLLDRVEAGEEVIIGRSGRPVARLVPYKRPGVRRRPGAWRNKVRIADDFDELPEEILAAFRGERS